MDPVTLLLLAAVGGGLWYWNKNKQQTVSNAQASIPPLPPPGLTFDPGMTQATQDTVNQELTTDNDPVSLNNLANTLAAKGYTNSAAALRAKATAVTAAGQALNPPATPPTVLVQTPPVVVSPGTVTIPQGVVQTPSGSVPIAQLVDPSTPMTYVEVQHALNQLGIAGANGQPLTEDGLPGPNTTYAISAFEGAHSLTQDGVPGPEVYAALRGALAAANIGL